MKKYIGIIIALAVVGFILNAAGILDLGIIVRIAVTLALLVVVFAFLLGKGSSLGWFIKIAALGIIAAFVVLFWIRGSWIPNAGGGLAIDGDRTLRIDNTDHPISITTEDTSEESFDHNLEYYLQRTDSDKYNPELSHLLIALSNAVHNKNWIEASYDSMGFSHENTMSDYELKNVLVAYSITKKILSNGTQIVVLTVRGTRDEAEKFANLKSVPDHYGRHSDFSDQAEKLHKVLLDFAKKDADLSDTVFVLTGHSRGAAVVNIIAAMLVDERIKQEHVYCYCFACPDTAYLTEEQVEDYRCIFNIGNVNDFVSWVPWGVEKQSGVFYGFSGDSYWNKYGRSYWYSDSDWKGDLNVNLLDFSHHMQGLYLDYLRNEKSINEYKERKEVSDIINIQ